MKLYFKEDFSVLDTDQTITVDCNSITVINIGSTNVKLNGLNLIPGAQFVSEGNVGEINQSRYQIILNSGSVLVIRKNYTNF